MFRSPLGLVALAKAGRPVRLGVVTIGLVAGMLSAGGTVRAQDAAATVAAKNPYMFAGDAAMTLNFIKADKTADFEMVIAKLKEALQKSTNPTRKQQAMGWKIFKASEAGPNGSVLYVSIVDPVVKGSDYTVSTILSEAFPTEVQALYKTYSEAYVSQNLINLAILTDLK